MRRFVRFEGPSAVFPCARSRSPVADPASGGAGIDPFKWWLASGPSPRSGRRIEPGRGDHPMRSASAFAGNTLVWRPCWPDSTTCQATTALLIHRCKTCVLSATGCSQRMGGPSNLFGGINRDTAPWRTRTVLPIPRQKNPV